MMIFQTLFLVAAVPLGPAPAKLIEWGGDSPNNAAFRQNIEMLEAAPFDGTVLSVTGKDGDKPVDLGWDPWGKRKFERAFFADAVKDLKSTKRSTFTDCFVRFNVTPGDVHFIDDAAWAVVVNNAKVAAWVAKEGGLKGWMFDTEQYTHGPFSYPGHNKLKPASFDDYRKLAEQRGREFMNAINSEYPDITILFAFAHSLLIREINPWRETGYALMPAFIDGMLEAADERATIVDALELAYPSRSRADLVRLRALVRDVGRGFSSVPEIYDKRMKVGFGIWIDYDSAGRGWDPHHPEKNYYTPELLQEMLRAALELTDEYVWLYSERLDWYTRRAMTEPYLMAVANAQTPTKKVPASKPGP